MLARLAARHHGDLVDPLDSSGLSSPFSDAIRSVDCAGARSVRTRTFGPCVGAVMWAGPRASRTPCFGLSPAMISAQKTRSEEHTSELQSRGLISYPVSCL